MSKSAQAHFNLVMNRRATSSVQFGMNGIKRKVVCIGNPNKTRHLGIIT